MSEKVLVTGAGGFIGGHLIASLLEQGHDVRAVDAKEPDAWYQVHEDADSRRSDVSEPEACREAMRGVDAVYNLAADMGGMGFIEANKALCMLSVLINTNMLIAAREAGVGRYFFSSSACVYAAEHADVPGRHARSRSPTPIRPCPRTATAGRSCSASACAGTSTRTSAWRRGWPATTTCTARTAPTTGGREKAPAAICRKVIEAKLSGKHQIEIWGDGQQTRSFMYVDDCVAGSIMLAGSDVREPLNIGSSELVTINDLVSIVEQIADITLERSYKLDAPQGVRGRNSDNTLILERLGWEPSISLRDGLEKTYSVDPR